jgi:hypothetical protein
VADGDTIVLRALTMPPIPAGMAQAVSKSTAQARPRRQDALK